MATQLQIRRGTSAQVAAFTGAEGEIVVNTTNDSVHVNDGSTAGGFELARADLNNVSDTDLNAALTGNTVSALTITTLTLGATAITATGAELNYVDGVTSAIQTQIDAKAPLASPTFTGTVTADGGTIVSTGSNAFSSKAVGGYAIQAYQDATSADHTALDLRSDATTGTRYLIRGYNDAAGTPTEVFSVGADGSAFLNSNVGIGSSSPSSPLEVAGGSAYPTTKISRDGGSAATQGYLTTGFSAIGYSGGTGADTYMVSEHGFGFAVNAGTSAMTITDGGNVGIGTSPDTRLQIKGGINSSQLILGGTDNRGLKISTTAVGGQNDSGVIFDAQDTEASGASSTLIFSTGGTEAMRIDGSNNVLVGDTSVIRASSQDGVSVEPQGRVYMSRGTGTGGFTHLAFINGNGIVGSVVTSGSATSYNTSSDQRLKENIADADDAGSTIDSIQVRQYDWKADGSHQDYGMIAQELQAVAPEAVSGDADSENMMGVDYSKLVPMLVKEIQSLRARVAQLENN